MKRLFFMIVTIAFAMVNSYAQYLMGDFNTWQAEDLMTESYSYYSVTVDVASDLPSGQFLVDQAADDVDTWGDATDSYYPVVNMSEGQMRGSISGDVPVTFAMSFTAGKFYTFRLEGDETWWNRKFVVMETDAMPVDILTVSDNSLTENENDVTVSITLSDILSTQETVYLRYTTDSWSTSSIVACSGSGTDYSGIIPGQVASTNVEYYVFSSAMESTFVSLYPDFSTLKGNNNSGSNFTYTVTSSSGSLTATPTGEMNSTSLDGMVLDLVLTSESFVDGTFEQTNFTLNNAPPGLTINGVLYSSPTEANIQLAYTGDPIMTEINDFNITIAAAELDGATDLTSNNMTIYADETDTESLYDAAVLTWEGGAEDVEYLVDDFDGHDFGTLNASSSLYLKSGKDYVWKVSGGDIVSAKMFYRIYKDGDTPGAFVEQVLDWESETVSNDTTYQVWWNDAPDETNLNLLESVTAGLYNFEVYFEAENGESEILTLNNGGSNYIAQFTYEETAALTATPTGEMNSTSLDGMVLDLVLTSESFVDGTFEQTNFTLNNAPPGLTINGVLYSSPTEANIQLAYTGDPIMTEINDFNITIAAAELDGATDLTSNNMTIYADVEHEGIYLCKVSMWEGSGDDTWYDEVDFDGHNFGSFNSEMSLYFKTGQVFSWEDSEGEIVSAAINYRIYKDGDTPGAFTNVDLPYYSEWASGSNTDKLWWNDSPDEIDINLLDGAEEGTYFLEVYYEAETGGGETIYMNNGTANYIASFTYTTNPILVATPASSMNEENLEGMEITLSITEDNYADAILDAGNFTLNNPPTGLEISDVVYVGPYEATVVLTFDGTDFDIDVTDFSVSVAGTEFNAEIDLTSNNMTITAIDEDITIFSHLLTADDYQRYLGDNGSYWIDMEIGQLEWDGAQIGYGTSSTIPDDWEWYNAEWYEDGEDENKRVHSFITVPNEVGTVYYAGRVRNTAEGTWFYANSADWSESDALDAVYTIEILELPPVTSSSASGLDGTRINIDWTPDPMFTNVMIIAKATDVITTDPEQGTTYATGEIIDGAEVIYKGNAGNFIHTGLENNTTYNYNIYTINNDYYSISNSTSAATDDSEGCTFTLDLGEDVNVCGGSSVLLNTGLIVQPFGDTITVYFNTSEHPDFAALDVVYMHAGVYLAGGSTWDYVIGNWGEDDGLGQMTQFDANTWMISFNPLDYFGYPSESELLGINLVFRNDDGTLIAQNPDTEEDYYIDMSVTPPVSSHSTLTTDFVQTEIENVLWSTEHTTSSISVSMAGEYSVIATDIYGCVGMDTINVELHAIPYVELGEDQTVCGDSEVILDAGEFESYEWNVDSITQTITVSDPGVYIVTVTDIYGCTGFDVVNIDLIDFPIAEFSYELTGDFTVEFSDSSENADTYSWDFDGDEEEDSNVAGDVSYTYSELGQYAVTLTVTNQCGEDSYSEIIYILSVEGINKINTQIYPNPVSSILTIEFDEQYQDGELELYDIAGKLILNQKIDSKRINIDVNEYKSGLYLLKAIVDGNQTEYKIIIK